MTPDETTTNAKPQVPTPKSKKSKPVSSPSEYGMKKGQDRHGMFWYPRRCEVEGCDHTDTLMKCGGCRMVQYCSQDHQKSDWETHKKDCKVFKRNNLKAYFYTDKDMLAQYPLQSKVYVTDDDDDDKDDDENDDSSDDYDDGQGHGYQFVDPLPQATIDMVNSGDGTCTVCCCPPGSKPLTLTQCCRQVICDTSDEYQMFSYSREFCERSHERYTLCGYHVQSGECDESNDWRECEGCDPMKEGLDRLPDMLWRGLNPYNNCPLLSARVPRHSLCETCTKCDKKFMSGLEGSSYSSAGMTCLPCSGCR